MTFVTTPVEFVEFIMMTGLLVLGLSHIIQPKMWGNYFCVIARTGSGKTAWHARLYHYRTDGVGHCSKRRPGDLYGIVDLVHELMRAAG
ncbi:MAG: hypothetical protein L3J83_05270 [Proteobacteria bacterium]|nr:hypothetical protein [Pseudomonadota bacterium]